MLPGPWTPTPRISLLHTHITDGSWHPCPSLRGQFALSLGARGEGWLWRVHQRGRDHGSHGGASQPPLRGVTWLTAEEMQTDAL